MCPWAAADSDPARAQRDEARCPDSHCLGGTLLQPQTSMLALNCFDFISVREEQMKSEARALLSNKYSLGAYRGQRCASPDASRRQQGALPLQRSQSKRQVAGTGGPLKGKLTGGSGRGHIHFLGLLSQRPSHQWLKTPATDGSGGQKPELKELAGPAPSDGPGNNLLQSSLSYCCCWQSWALVGS